MVILAPHAETDFLFRVAILNVTDDLGGFANAVLLDAQRGILVTNAHVLNLGNKLENNKGFLLDGDRYTPLIWKKHWFNWTADLALVQVENREILRGHTAVQGLKVKASPYTDVQVVGYRNGNIETLRGSVGEWDGSYGVTRSSLEEQLAAESTWFLPRNERIRLYKSYELIAVSQELLPSMSGSAILTKEHVLVGILSSAVGKLGLAIPYREIASLLSDAGIPYN